jgi:peptide/nickel transport system substrate-binding protein
VEKLSNEKCVFLIAIAVLSALLAVPTYVKAQTTTTNEVRFILGTTSVISLNPMTSYTYGMFRSALYSQLFIQNATLQPSPWLALSYSQPNDTTWVVNLRHNATWHDGQPVTSQDVKFTINLVQAAGGSMARFVQGIASVTTPDNYTVVVRTATPTLIAGWLTGLDILPEHYWVAQGAVGAAALNFTNNPPIGSGPFKFVDWVPGEYIEFQAFNNFFMGRPKIDSLVIRQYASQADMEAALKSGEIDGADYIPISDVAALNQVPGLATIPEEMNTVEDIYLNLNTNHSQGNPTLLDKNVRLALMYAINRTYLNDQLYGGLYHPALSIIPDMFGSYYCSECQSLVPPFNLTKANQILDQAGYKMGPNGIRVSPSGVPLSYRFWIFNGYPEMARGAQIIKGWWNQIGVDITYTTMEGGALWDAISSPPYNWDMAVWDWLVNDESSIIYSYTSNAIQTGYSSSGLSDPAFDAMYQAQLTTTNQTQRIQIIHNVQKYMIQNAVEIDLFYMTFVSAYWANKWTGLVAAPGSALYIMGPNSQMFLYIQPVAASATTAMTTPTATNSTAGPPATSSGWTAPAAILAIIVILAAAVYMRRRKATKPVETK